TRHHHNISAVDRSGATFQTYPVPAPDANPASRTHTSNQTNPTRTRSAQNANQILALKI
ncbi:hypothetical protein QFZ69_004547, partial [Arthrobacter sp. V1I7]|nr:hypothetical protein [Arthrobacter sp. V1I7]